MIATLTGQVAEKNDKHIILDVGGVGYKVSVLDSLQGKINIGDETNLRIHHHLSDNSEDLYGFSDQGNLSFFELLITVPSVGPRTAMGILEIAPPQVLRQAVSDGDATLLTKVSGVGKKTAERILVELKERIDAPEHTGTSGGIQQEAVEALVSIGYTKQQARQAVQKLPPEIQTVEEAVKTALQKQTK